MISLFSKDIVMFKSTFPSLWRLVFEVVKNALEKFMFMIPTVSYYGFFFKANAIFYVLDSILWALKALMVWCDKVTYPFVYSLGLYTKITCMNNDVCIDFQGYICSMKLSLVQSIMLLFMRLKIFN